MNNKNRPYKNEDYNYIIDSYHNKPRESYSIHPKHRHVRENKKREQLLEGNFKKR